jgi:hypothetical protein
MGVAENQPRATSWGFAQSFDPRPGTNSNGSKPIGLAGEM